MSTPAVKVTVLLGAPLANLDRYAEGLAASSGGIYLGDLNLAYGDTVDELLQVYELSQITLHPALFDALTRHAGHADPRGFLEANRHWSLGELLRYLMAQAAARHVVFSDAAAGFRVVMLDRWLDALPGGTFVHATTALAAFTEDARRRYDGRLFIPPDYLDHSDLQPAPRFAPEIAWFQMHLTLLRVLGERADRKSCRIALDRDPPASLAAIAASKPLMATTAMPRTIEALAKQLGY